MNFRREARRAGGVLAVLLVAGMIGGCGGGQAPAAAGTPDSGTSGPDTSGDPPPAARQSVAHVTLQNTAGADQAHVTFSFGQPFAPGDLKAGEGLVGVLADGSRLPLQLDVKATHADGSVRHAVVSGVLPKLSASESQTLTLASAAAPAVTALPTIADLLKAGFSASVRATVGGVPYSASAETLLAAGGATPWLQGPVANEWLVSGPLKDAQGNAHPHLSARFAVRWYAGQSRAKVDVIVENDWAYEPAPQNFTYDLQVQVGGSTVYNADALTHYHHARWRKSFWWGGEPQLNLQHDIGYLVATRAVPSYDTTLVPSEAGLSALAQRWATTKTGLMAPGIVLPYMPTTGGRPDIGPLPQWAAMYLLSMDARAKAVTLGVGDLAGSWPIHYRDKPTGRPVSLDDHAYMTLLGRPGDTVNPKTKQSEAFPACGGTCTTAPYNYAPDSAHQPSLAYLPYLVTGDHYYLEELQFWANYNMLQHNPAYRSFDKGLLRPDQVRGQAWSLRTLGQAAYITPDADPMKAYFVQRVANNIDWYTATYVTNPPNALGVLDGSGQYAFNAMAYNTPAGAQTGIGPWQDDFFTWSVGYLAELGFDTAKPLLTWKAQFPVSRMTSASFCWIDGAVYALAVRPAVGSPLYGSVAEAYQATMRDTDSSGTAVAMTNSTGARYLDQPCGSQAQADWRTQKDKDTHTVRNPWVAGEMTGYASSAEGFPSNMQPALAVAATFGAPNAQAAWDRFITRGVKPDYSAAPQWAVVPRGR